MVARIKACFMIVILLAILILTIMICRPSHEIPRVIKAQVSKVTKVIKQVADRVKKLESINETNDE